MIAVSGEACLELQVGARKAEEAIYDSIESLVYMPSGYKLGFDDASGRLDQGKSIVDNSPNRSFTSLEAAIKFGKYFLDLKV